VKPQLVDSELVVEDRIATLRLRRDDVRNELTGTALAAEIATVAEWADRDDEVSVLIITGSGKSFSAGGNIKDIAARRGVFAGDMYELQQTYRRGIQQMALKVHRTGLPTIAAINGAAIGAGFDLACMCDIRVAARGAILGETFVKLGLIPGDGGAWFLQRLVGYERAAELTFTGRTFTADEAQQLGLVLDVVDGDELEDKVETLATQIAEQPPRALRMAKRLMRTAQKAGLEHVLDLSASYQAAAHHNREHSEALQRLFPATSEGMR
jgi:enoyl-CoA hydratase/carnithine racemase